MFQNLGVIFTSTAHSQLHKYLSHACNNDPLVHHDHIIIICILIDIFIITYLLTPWFRVLPEQLTGLQLVKKFPAFHGTRRFITALTSVRYPYYIHQLIILLTYTHMHYICYYHIRSPQKGVHSLSLSFMLHATLFGN